MEEKGYIVCLLKYMIGHGTGDSQKWDDISGNRKPISLGYFGRVDVAPVTRFKEYMDLASTHHAEFMGSRKQLLLYPLDAESKSQIKLRPDSVEENRLPFQPSGGGNPCFCCLSVLNINQPVKNVICSSNYSNGIRKIAGLVAGKIEQSAVDKAGNRQIFYAVMGLLGTEDLCVIMLSDRFETITGAINGMRGLVSEQAVPDMPVVENSHSILMVDFSDQADKPDWGSAKAEIHFSLKTAMGLSYLNEIRGMIQEHAEGHPVILENRVGEYDAVIRCPASALGAYLYGYNGAVNYGNKTYRKIAYQSETILYTQDSLPFPQDFIGKDFSEKDESDEAGMKLHVERAVRAINTSILGNEEDLQGDTAYIRQVLFRLLKDFMQITATPFGQAFQKDLQVQFETAITAVVYAARNYQRLKSSDGSAAQDVFDRDFSRIIDALSNSMQAASQIDRLCFEEQSSHLQNTGAYHKVLIAYYGIVKSVLRAIYAIPRLETSRQPLLIPLISFGHTQIICSRLFETAYNSGTDRREVPARLICITLPYQALANIPKYIGPLAHELFHYATPADRTEKNIMAGNCLAAVALQCFLNEVASHVPGCLSQSGRQIFYQYREEFLEVVDGMSHNIQQNVAWFAEEWHLAQPGEAVKSDLFFGCAHEELCPPLDAPAGNPQERLYFEAWLELRHLFLKLGAVDSSTRALLALDQHFVEDGGDGSGDSAGKKLSAWKHFDDLYQRSLAHIAVEIPSRLGIYETVMREIPPDLFDIGCVMRGKSNHEQAKQYLWQLHSIRSDKLFYSHRLPGKVDWLDGNIIRIGMVLDHLLFGTLDEEGIKTFDTRKNRIEGYLQQWYGNESHRSQQQMQEREKNRQAIASDYAAYAGESLFANVMLGSYIRRITEQLGSIWEILDLNPEIERLSKFYCQYYNALDSANEDACSAVLFDLSIQMIEAYQCQQNLRELRNECGKAPKLKANAVAARYPTVPFNTSMYEIPAFQPGELFQCIMQSSRSMRLDRLHAQLWYRGQRLEQRNLLPTIMRKPEKADTKYVLTEDGFLYGMRRMMTLAKAKILPQGSTYSKAEWLALLQHHDFHTNLLDWSEDPLTALFFAIERWEEKVPEGNAAVAVLNPVLLNLACDMLDKKADKDANKVAYEAALDRLCNYLNYGSDNGETSAVPLFDVSTDEGAYREYFDLTADFSKKSGPPIRRPIAAMTPINNERMRAQAGMFTFCDIRAKPEKGADGALTYEAHDLMNIQSEYIAALRAEAQSCPAIPEPVPFLLKIILNCANFQVFTEYLRAINMRKYKVYPELNNLATDIMDQSF